MATKKSSISKPIGSKGAKIPKLKGGKGMPQVNKNRGGYGAARPNFGKLGSKAIKPIGGRGK
ncbi:MAG TPA: hypothetical protein VF974_07500 [Patescibacteria group bacterium]